MSTRLRFALLLVCAGAFVLAACGDQAPVEPSLELEGAPVALLSDEPTDRDNDFLPQLKVGYFTVCKVADGATRTFTFETNAVGPGVPTAPVYEPVVELGDGECADVYAAPVIAGSDMVTISEIVPAGWQVDRVFIWSLDVINGVHNIITSHELPAGTSTVSGSISAGKLGCVVIFYNSEIPREGECSRTPGYWKTHPEAWPVEEITIGGTTYSKDDAIDLLWLPERGDKSKTVFRALVAARLNNFNGTDTSCVSQEILDADAWMAAHPVCSNVSGNSDAWSGSERGETLATTLDDYNNGLLCAPHCDDPDEEDGGQDVIRTAVD